MYPGHYHWSFLEKVLTALATFLTWRLERDAPLGRLIPLLAMHSDIGQDCIKLWFGIPKNWAMKFCGTFRILHSLCLAKLGQVGSILPGYSCC